jgi:hypothetical protein
MKTPIIQFITLTLTSFAAMAAVVGLRAFT